VSSKVSLVYRVSSGTVRAVIQRNPTLKKKRKQTKTTKQNKTETKPKPNQKQINKQTKTKNNPNNSEGKGFILPTIPGYSSSETRKVGGT
jgi:ribosomal protein L13E